jgi:transcriptional regulator with XRE-family HTH domain
VALLSSPSVKRAAERCDVSERTLFNYLEDERFVSELKKRQDQLLQAVTTSLSGLATRACEVLDEVMNDEDATAPCRTRAATAALQYAREWRELGELSERLIALEMRLQIGGKL